MSIVGVFILVLSLIFIFWKKGLQQKMEHMVGRLATKLLKNMLEQVRQKIITDGYEHWKFDLYEKDYELPDMFRCHFTIKNLLFTGASKFVTNNVSYDVTTSSAIFDISIPKLFLAIGDVSSGVEINVFGMDIEAQVKGWITFLEPRMTGAVVLEVNEEGKLTATSVDIKIELQQIQSKIHLTAMDSDFSEGVNNFLSNKLPVLINNYVDKFKAEIEAGVKSIANPILATMF